MHSPNPNLESEQIPDPGERKKGKRKVELKEANTKKRNKSR